MTFTSKHTSTPPLLSIKDLSFSRRSPEGPLKVMEHLNLSLDTGSSLAILGPSGCGKTTLLHIIAGLVKNYSGTLLFNGKPLTEPSNKISVIFQNYGLFPWKRVWENLLLGLHIQKNYDKKAVQNAEAILEQFGIIDLKNRFISELSEGQKQRLAIARSLILDPDLLILDEPFSSLDSLTKYQLQEILYQNWKERGFSLIMVTHSIEEAAFIGENILLLSRSPARIQETIKNPLTLGSTWVKELPEFCQNIRDKLHSPAL